MTKKPAKQTFPEPGTPEEARLLARIFLTGCAIAGELAAQTKDSQWTDPEVLGECCVEVADAALKKLDL